MINYSCEKQCVVLGLSGGIDSATSAWLLKKRGFKVVAVTFKLWEYRTRRNSEARTDKRVDAAKALCEKIGIEHHVLDISEQFRMDVVEYFLKEYASGRTPNPCVVCNRVVKWKNLVDFANKIGCYFVATGHYARVLPSPIHDFNLLRGADTQKEQSYFLYRLDKSLLARTIFPVGHLTKKQVYEVSSTVGLPTITLRESQELCFLPERNLRRFLMDYIPEATQPGPIFDTSGKRVGTHGGIAFYTVGQREGLGGGFKQPMYVVKIIADENAIVVGPKSEVYAREFAVDNLVLHRELKKFRALVKVRYRHEGGMADVEIHGKRALVKFDSPQPAITPGQSAVFYDGMVVLGGGIIKEVMA